MEKNCLCACGCGLPLTNKTKYDYGNGRPRRFIHHHKAQKTKVNLVCRGCGDSFHLVPNKAKGRKYCTRQCAIKNVCRPSTAGRQWSKRIQVICPICQKSYTVREREIETGRAMTCSKSCGDKLRGTILQRRSMTSPQTQKKWILKERPHLCQDCGYHKEPGILTIHHIDENKANGSTENIILLCPNCHAERHFISRTGMFKGLDRRSRKLIPENFLSRNERESPTIQQ